MSCFFYHLCKKMIMTKWLMVHLVCAGMLLSYGGCKNNNADSNYHQMDQDKLKEKLVRANKEYYGNEDEAINDFVSRMGYNMQKTQRGVRYHIFNKNNGTLIKEKQKVEIKYVAKLLDGTLCYTSDSTGNLEFEIGKTDLPVGLQEGLLQMSKGEKAILVSPSNLGYGLTGDGAAIPSNAVLVYEVEVVEVK